MSRKRKRAAELTMMDAVWVATAVALAYMKENEIPPADYFRAYLRDKDGLWRRLDAFRRDPNNLEAILAARAEAAEVIGRGAARQ